MSIKSDKWIRRMALEKEMISPFESGQVRAEGANRVISYGVSSYGYDVRCAMSLKFLPILIQLSSILRIFAPRALWIFSPMSALFPRIPLPLLEALSISAYPVRFW